MPPTAAVLVAAVVALAVSFGPAAGTAFADLPPFNLMPPTLTSTNASIGATLSVMQGTWSDAAGGISDAWERCDAASNCTSTGVTGTSYTVTQADVGDTLMVAETAHAADGTPSNPADSNQSSRVAPPPAPTNTTPPTIAGTPAQDQTLTAGPGAWTDSPSSYFYQWQDCDSGGHGCTAIPGATGSTYVLVAGDVGHTIVVNVSGVNAGGTGAAAASAATALVQTTSRVSLTTSAARLAVNQPVTLGAIVKSRAAGDSPVGSVQFTNQGRPIDGCAAAPIRSTGQSVTVLCQASFGAGDTQLAATFLPAAGSLVLGSSSATRALSVRQTNSTTALDVPAHPYMTARTTYTARVQPGRNGPTAPSGTVQFTSGARTIPGCKAQPVRAGRAGCTLRYTSLGGRSIRARYDGDANFAGSSSPVKRITVTPLPAKGTITAKLQWTFYYTPSYTRVVAMLVNGAPRGATVQTQCHGGGCPFAARTATIRTPKFSLLSAFAHHNLRPGAQITIMVQRAKFVGKYYRFTIRARRQPSVRIACLAVGSTRPGVGC